MNNTKKPTEIIFGSYKEEVNRRILKIENSLVGINHKSPKRDESDIVIEGLPYPIFDDKKSISEIMEMDNIPGCCIALINNYDIEWVKCYGVRKIGTRDKITVKTLFQAASISKILISLMALHLVDKNLITLDEPINNKLKDWKIPKSDFTKEKEITIKHILTHTSGINPPANGFSNEEGLIPTIDQVLKGEAPAKNDPVKVEFEPESKHQYSNLGFIVVEKLLQDIYSKKTNDIAKEIIFEPLGISNSYFVFPSEELQKRMIYPHDGNGKAYEPYVGLSPSIFGCGGLITNPYDLAKIAIELMKAYQGKSNKIISTSIAKKMLSRNVALNPLKMWGLTGQGLGIFLSEKGDDFFFDHKGGNYPGASGVLMANPKSGHGVVVMANSIMGHKQLFESIKFTLAKEYGWSLWSE